MNDFDLWWGSVSRQPPPIPFRFYSVKASFLQISCKYNENSQRKTGRSVSGSLRLHSWFRVSHVSCLMFHVSCSMFHVSCSMFHVSCLMFHVSCLMFHISCIIFHISNSSGNRWFTANIKFFHFYLLSFQNNNIYSLNNPKSRVTVFCESLFHFFFIIHAPAPCT